MEINSDEVVSEAIKVGFIEAVKEQFGGYHSPVELMIKNAIKNAESEIQGILNEAIKDCLSDTVFRDNLKESTRCCLAKTLVKRFGGELEKQINALKSDPTTRARIVMAIEEIVSEKT